MPHISARAPRLVLRPVPMHEATEALPDPRVEQVPIELRFRLAHESPRAGERRAQKAIEHGESAEQERLAEDQPVCDLEEKKEPATSSEVIDFSVHRARAHEADARAFGL